MNGYSSAFWLALCASLTALGLVLTVLVGRKRGTRSMLHGAAWSLIPIAAYMTGSTLMLWRIGEAIGSFASSFVFSTLRWAGIGVVALIVVLFLASGGRKRRRAAREGRVARKQEKKAAEAGGGGSAGPVTAGSRDAVTSGAAGGLGLSGAGRVSESARTPVTAPRNPESARRAKAAGGKPAAGNDMADIEEILRKRGILPATHEWFDSPMREGVGVVISRL